MAWPSLPSTGSPGAASPASSVLWKAPTPCRPSRRAVFPRPSVPLRPGSFRVFGLHAAPSELPDRSSSGRGLTVPVSPVRPGCRGGGGASQVPGGTFASMPGSSTPADRTCQALSARPIWPSAIFTTSAPRFWVLSRLNRRACSSGCLRFAAPIARGPRKTRFRLLARHCRTGLVTRTVPFTRFSFHVLRHGHTSLPRLCLAHKKRTQAAGRKVNTVGRRHQGQVEKTNSPPWWSW